MVTTVSTTANFPGGSGSTLGGYMHGPFCDTNGNLYAALVNETTRTSVQMLKSGDAGANWSEVDAGNRPDQNDGTARGNCDGVFGTLCAANQTIYIAVMTSNFVVLFDTFRTSAASSGADTWGTVDKVVIDYTATGAEQGTSIAVSETDPTRILILSAGEENPAGFEHVEYHYSTDGGANWTNAGLYDDGGGPSSFDCDTGLVTYNPDTGKFWGMWRRDDTNYLPIRSQTDVNASPSSHLDSWTIAGQHNAENYLLSTGPIAYGSGANETVVVLYPDLTNVYPYATYIVNGSVGTTTQVTATAVAKGGGFSTSTDHQAGLGIVHDGTDVYVVMADATNRDIQIHRNQNNSSWSAWNSSVTTGQDVDRLCCTLYTRAGWVRIGILWDNQTGGDPKGECRFEEVQVRELNPWTPQTNAPEKLRVVSSGLRW